jgi:hypothetical protein
MKINNKGVKINAKEIDFKSRPNPNIAMTTLVIRLRACYPVFADDIKKSNSKISPLKGAILY